MGWDQGSQARDLGSLVVGSGSVVLQVIRDSFPTKKCFNRKDLLSFKNSVVFLA